MHVVNTFLQFKIKGSVIMLDTIKKLCKENDISVARLEQELGYGKGSIYRWDKTSPAVSKIEQVADFFDVSVDYILGKTNHYIDALICETTATYDSNKNSILLDIIIKLCKERGISIQKLEAVLGLDNGTIYRWTEVSPSVEKIEKIADFFGVSIDYIMGKTDIDLPANKIMEIRLPQELHGLGIEYIELTKDLKDSNLDIDEIKQAVEFARTFKKKNESTPK